MKKSLFLLKEYLLCCVEVGVLLLVLSTNFGDATKLFIAIYLFFLKGSGKLLASLFSPCFKMIND
jgi:hypothetical protein